MSEQVIDTIEAEEHVFHPLTNSQLFVLLLYYGTVSFAMFIIWQLTYIKFIFSSPTAYAFVPIGFSVSIVCGIIAAFFAGAWLDRKQYFTRLIILTTCILLLVYMGWLLLPSSVLLYVVSGGLISAGYAFYYIGTFYPVLQSTINRPSIVVRWIIGFSIINLASYCTANVIFHTESPPQPIAFSFESVLFLSVFAFVVSCTYILRFNYRFAVHTNRFSGYTAIGKMMLMILIVSVYEFICEHFEHSCNIPIPPLKDPIGFYLLYKYVVIVVPALAIFLFSFRSVISYRWLIAISLFFQSVQWLLSSFFYTPYEADVVFFIVSRICTFLMSVGIMLWIKEHIHKNQYGLALSFLFCTSTVTLLYIQDVVKSFLASQAFILMPAAALTALGFSIWLLVRRNIRP